MLATVRFLGLSGTKPNNDKESDDDNREFAIEMLTTDYGYGPHLNACFAYCFNYETDDLRFP